MPDPWDAIILRIMSLPEHLRAIGYMEVGRQAQRHAAEHGLPPEEVERIACKMCKEFWERIYEIEKRGGNLGTEARN